MRDRYFLIWPQRNYSWFKRAKMPWSSYHKRINHTTMNAFKEVLVGYGWWGKEKRDWEGITLTRTSFNKRDGGEKQKQKAWKKLFPLIKKREQNKGKKYVVRFLEFPGLFRVSNLTAVEIQISWCVQISRNQEFPGMCLICNADCASDSSQNASVPQTCTEHDASSAHVHSSISSPPVLSSLTQIQTN